MIFLLKDILDYSKKLDYIASDHVNFIPRVERFNCNSCDPFPYVTLRKHSSGKQLIIYDHFDANTKLQKKIADLEQKLASVKTICYECDAQVWELSPRSRCVKCEHRRAIFNEKDSDSLREKLECKNQ